MILIKDISMVRKYIDNTHKLDLINYIINDKHFFLDLYETPNYEILIKPFVELLEKTDDEIRLVIDSVAYLILEFGLNDVYKLIFSLNNHPKGKKKIISLNNFNGINKNLYFS